VQFGEGWSRRKPDEPASYRNVEQRFVRLHCHERDFHHGRAIVPRPRAVWNGPVPCSVARQIRFTCGSKKSRLPISLIRFPAVRRCGPDQAGTGDRSEIRRLSISVLEILQIPRLARATFVDKQVFVTAGFACHSPGLPDMQPLEFVGNFPAERQFVGPCILRRFPCSGAPEFLLSRLTGHRSRRCRVRLCQRRRRKYPTPGNCKFHFWNCVSLRGGYFWRYSIALFDLA
jgi:hypothetical protein